MKVLSCSFQINLPQFVFILLLFVYLFIPVEFGFKLNNNDDNYKPLWCNKFNKKKSALEVKAIKGLRITKTKKIKEIY